MKLDIENLPNDPGVYLFKDAKGEILYIGKAKNLQKRVASYFLMNITPKTRVLVSKIKNVEHIVVDNEVESLLLENRLIKKHLPKYNVSLKDSKTYGYIKITDETFPRIFTARRVVGKGKYFGPYVDGKSRHELISLCTKLFKIRVCKKLPKHPCINYYIGTCSAPCISGKKEEYRKQIDDAENFLKGDTAHIETRLRGEMLGASKEMKYETALIKRRQLDAIEALKQKQKVDTIRRQDRDVIAFKTHGESIKLSMFSMRRGVLQGKKDFTFSLALETPSQRAQSFVKLYYSQGYIPHLIAINSPIWESEQERASLCKFLSQLRKSKTSIFVPSSGEALELINLAEKNLDVSSESLLVEIQNMLNLPVIPSIIEVFDASNLGDIGMVGAMTRWVDGKIDKSGYRNFKIKTISEQNDFASIKEIVFRRYSRLIEEKQQLPNLILIDGGIGQMNSAMEALKMLGLQIPIISIAKENEEIYVPGKEKPLQFNKSSKPMLLLRAMRDSVHRRAVSYNRILRKKQVV